MRALKVFFASVFIFLFQAAVFSAEITFTAVSDAGLKADKANNSMTPTISNLLKVKEDINSSGSDAVLFLGNNIQSADGYDLVMFAKVINKIQKPVYTCIGNKDTQKAKHLDKKEYFRLLNKFSKNKTSKLPSAKKINNFIFIFMDGTNEMVSMPRGYFKDRELIILDKYLNKYKNKDVIIVQHFPAIEVNDALKSTYNSKEYLKLISSHKNVKAVISGLEGEDFEIERDNIVHINVPSLSDTLEYKVITLKSQNQSFLTKTKTISIK